MDEPLALDAFAALSQETRLKMLRALVKAGPEGLAAGTVGQLAGASSSSASFHLAHLERAGLVRSRRMARSIIYAADYAALAELVAFLMQECCEGQTAAAALAGQTLPEGGRLPGCAP